MPKAMLQLAIPSWPTMSTLSWRWAWKGRKQSWH
jgi:hypothetical protein